MVSYIFTVEAINPKTSQRLDISHWTITARHLDEASAIIEGRVENVNRTIPSVRNSILLKQTHSRGVCNYLDRSLQCQGHPVVKPLKQERGGNEGEQ